MKLGGEEKIKWLQKLSQQMGRPVQQLANMPKLFPHLETALEAFKLLSSSRSFGALGGLGPIPLGEIIAYLQWANVGSHTEERQLVRHLRALDNKFIEFHSKE